jgi:outer membrane protein with beta-barrel domain
MKSVWVGVLAAAVIGGAAHAHGETGVGILGGADMTTLHQERVLPTPGIHCDGFQYRRATQFAAGGVVEVAWKGKLAVRLEPMYAAKGSKYPDPVCYFPQPPGHVATPTPVKENDLRLAYLELPVLLAVHAGRGRLRPYFVGGPIVGYLASARVRRDGQEQDVHGLLNRWALGIAVGGGVRFTTGRAAAFVEGRYQLGLRGVGASGPYRPVSPQYASSRARGPQFLAGITCGVGQ